MNADNIQTSRPMSSGCMFRAPAGTTVPTDANSNLDSTFKDLGWLAADGIVQKIDRTVERLKAFGNSAVITWTSEHKVEYIAKFLELLNPEVWKMVVGADNVQTVSGTNKLSRVTLNSSELDNGVYVMEIRLRTGDKLRIVIPNGAVTSTEDLSLTDSDPATNGATIEALEDSYGNKAYLYFATPAASSALIRSYSISAQGMDFPGVIDHSAKTIAVTVPSGTTMTGLVASFVLSDGASAKIGTTAQVSGTTANDWTSGTAKTYKVTSADGQVINDYSVTITKAS